MKISLSTLRKMKADGEKIAVLTAYDASFARRVEAAGVEVILVGDSLGMVVQGGETTLAVSVDDIVYHSRAVVRGAPNAFVIADMPFLGDATAESALANAARLMKEGGAQMVKLEGGAAQVEIVRLLSGRSVPVCAHLGLQPQAVHKLGGYKVQGRNEAAAEAIIRDAAALEQAGAEMLVLECVPSRLAAEVSRAVSIPVIGIGAGPDTDGQVLVLYDMLGITPGNVPKFARNFLADSGNIDAALQAYVAAVKSGAFPGPEHGFN